MRKSFKFGRAADPEPMAILLLRGLRDLVDPVGEPGARLDRAAVLRTADRILKTWQERESVSQLREMLGVAERSQKAHRRRTHRVVQEETGIVCRLINLALSGHDVANFRKAADALNLDEKAVERAWKEWGDMYTYPLRDGLIALGKLTRAQSVKIMGRLPRIPD